MPVLCDPRARAQGRARLCAVCRALWAGHGTRAGAAQGGPALIAGGSDFTGGGFFTGYWLTTGGPDNFDPTAGLSFGSTQSLTDGIFVGGWYAITNDFRMTSGMSGVYVSPNLPPIPPSPAASVIRGLLASVVVEEAALAHLINAEAEKVQPLAAKMPTPSTFEQAAEMQKTVLAVLNAVVLKELVLNETMARALSMTVPP